MDAFALKALAEQTLDSHDAGEFTWPAAERPHQFSWDSSLAALGWVGRDPLRAYQELASVVGARDTRGMVSHMAFDHGARGFTPGPSRWGRRLSVDGRQVSAITHPPITATCLRLLYEAHPDPQRARALLSPLHAWHQLLLADRNYYGSHEPVLVHPWESARNTAAEWDGPMSRVAAEAAGDTDPPVGADDPALWLVHNGLRARWRQVELANLGPFRVLDPGFSAVLAAACADTAALANELGDEQMAAESEMLALSVSEAVLDRACADGLVRPVDLCADERIDMLGAGTALTLLLPSVPRPQLMALRNLVLDGALASPYGVRSQSSADAPALPWRGAVAASTTWLCALGLERHGERAAAELLRGRMLDGVRGGGLSEFVDPITGAAVGVRDSSVTAALTLHLLGR